MKILFSWHSAVEPEYRKLFKELVRLGHSLTVISPRSWTEGGRLQTINISNENGYRILPLSVMLHGRIKSFFYTNIFAIAGSLLKFKPDIVHIFEEPYSLSCFQQILLTKLFRPKAKIVVQSFENIFIKQGFPFSFVEKHILNNTDILISIPKEGADIWKKKGFSKSIQQVPVGVDSEYFKKTSKSIQGLGFLDKRDNIRIAYIGRLTPEKGISTLLEAFSGLTKEASCNIELLIVGNGEKEKFKDQAIELGIDSNTVFLDSIENRHLPALYSKVDILVLPSLTTPGWKEQFGRVLIEAMACEVAVVGSSSGEIPHVIGDAGLSFQEGNREALLQVLHQLISDTSKMDSVKRAGRERVLRTYSWSKVAEELSKVYE